MNYEICNTGILKNERQIVNNKLIMQKQSAGILLYRIKNKVLEVLLVHPGGPYWKNKDAGTWTIPKGEFTDQDDPLTEAKREFREELGFNFEGEVIKLLPIKQKGGKMVYAWASEGDINPRKIKSNLFEIEWPPGSGKNQMFPEVDKAGWFGIKEAKEKINKAQVPFIDELMKILSGK